jgi:hypothetical protein
VSRVLHVDDNGDGRGDRTVTVPMPVFHVLGLLSDMGDRYWVLPEQKTGGHKVAGFASRDDHGAVRILIYSHQAEDTQSRSGDSFDVTLDVEGHNVQGPARVEAYRFDQDHSSPFKLARSLCDRPAATSAGNPGQLAAVMRALEGSDRTARREARGARDGS